MRSTKARFTLAISSLAASVAFAAPTADLPFGPWSRAANAPVLSPQGSTWESAGTFNPAVLFVPDKPEVNSGRGNFHDLLHVQRKGVILPAYKGNWNRGWTKSGAIVPEKIDGKYWMYWLGTAADKTDQTGLSYSADLIHWTEATTTPVLPRRAGKFDSRVVEPGPPPILTKQDIVLIYNGADDNLVYRTGVAVFDRRDPRKLISRSDAPIFAPEKEWEKVGQVPNVVFVEGMVRTRSAEDVAGRWDHFLFYYGAADKYVGVAEAMVTRSKTIVTH